MDKRIFMLGDSHIWGTEQKDRNGKIVDYPLPVYNNREPDMSNLPSETTWPYFLDDWKQVHNLSRPGFGVDYIRHTFVHEVFDILEPDDVVTVYFPPGNRKLYSQRLSNVYNNDTPHDKIKSLKHYTFSSDNMRKLNRNWPDTFRGNIQVKTDEELVSGFDRSSTERFLKFNDTEYKQFVLNVDTFLDLTFFNSSSMIYQLLDTLLIIEKMANCKGNNNIFYVIDSKTLWDEPNNDVKENIKTVLGEKVSERILNWNWIFDMEFDFFKQSGTKDIKEWMHPEGHFTKEAHLYFADLVKEKVNMIRVQNEK